MGKRIAASVLAFGLGATLTTGCLGGMALTGKVRDFNLSVTQGKWPREAVFLLLYVVPVYPLASMADLLVVNAIEFHTGTNPISGKPRVATLGETREVTAADGTRVRSTLRADGSIDFSITPRAGEARFVNLASEGDRLVARDATGLELAAVPHGAGVHRR